MGNKECCSQKKDKVNVVRRPNYSFVDKTSKTSKRSIMFESTDTPDTRYSTTTSNPLLETLGPHDQTMYISVVD